MQIIVYQRHKPVYEGDFDGPVELGRQDPATGESPYSSSFKNNHWRVAIAAADQKALSRRHLLVEPLAGNRARITNLGQMAVTVSQGGELASGVNREAGLPLLLTIDTTAIRVAGEEAEVGLQSLGEATRLPGQDEGSDSRIPLLPLVDPGVPLDNMLRWLQGAVDVLQSAAGYADFFQRAARAVAELIGFDTGRALRLTDEGRWVVEATHVSGLSSKGDWQPSQRVLDKLRREKRTFWELPEGPSNPTGSLIGVQAVVAAPILKRDGTVVGALYGERLQGTASVSTPQISRLEAMLVELLACGVAAGLARLEQEQAALQAQVRFEQFFTPELARQLMLRPELLQGREAEVTVLFVDIRGFSRVAERLKQSPARTMEWINDVMGALSACVLEHGGVLVDYVGDELFAMWGAPDERTDHAEAACHAALAMLAAIPALNQRWQELLEEAVAVGIGINTGLAQVGNTGSRQKFKYGPLGNTVNLGSRVQGATKYLKSPILITDATREQLGERFATRRVCSVRVVNIKTSVGLYELHAAQDPVHSTIRDPYEQALLLFEQQNFRGAAQLLSNILADYPDDGPALVLLSRSVTHLVQPPATFDPAWELPGK